MENPGQFDGLKLGVVSGKRIWKDTEGVKTTGGFGHQVGAFDCYFDKLLLVVPFESRDVSEPGSKLLIRKLEIVPLPYFKIGGILGKLDFVLKAPLLFRQIWKAYPDCDVWQYRIPGYVGILGLMIHKLRRSRPAFIWLCADWAERIRLLGDSWIRRSAAKFVNYFIPWLIRDTPTFALGHLEERYRHLGPYVHPTKSTILKKEQIIKPQNGEISTPPRLLFVGRLAPEKGVKYLLKAMRILVDNDIELNIVGDGAERQNLVRMVEDLDLMEQVSFKGYVPAGDTLWQHYRQADIFVMPSLEEAQGKVQIEAMAAGLPIIASRVGGIPTTIESEVNGLLVEPGSSQEIAQAIQRLLTDPDLRCSLAQGAFERAHELTVEEQTETLMEHLADDLAKLGWLPIE